MSGYRPCGDAQCTSAMCVGSDHAVSRDRALVASAMRSLAEDWRTWHAGAVGMNTWATLLEKRADDIERGLIKP